MFCFFFCFFFGHDLAVKQHRAQKKEEIEMYAQAPGIKELLDATIGDSQTRELQLHLKAKQLLEEGSVDEAWKILLLN